MNINSGINQYNAHMSNSLTASASSSQSLTGNALSQLQEGQVFEGTVSGIENGRVRLSLVNGQVISAKLDSSVLLQEGQSLFFQVKSNENSLIQIRPVSITNQGYNLTLINALESAGLAVSQRSIAMVDSMMNESMPIDAESLGNMNRLLLSNPSIEPSTLTQLVKYGFPVTTENANMFNAYASDSASIKSSFGQIAQGLSKLFASTDISTEQVISLNDSINELINKENGTFVAGQTFSNLVSSETLQKNSASNDMPGVYANPDLKKVEGTNALKIDLSEIESNENAIATPLNEETRSDSSPSVTLINNIFTRKQGANFASILGKLYGFDKYTNNLFDEKGDFLKSANTTSLYKALSEYLNDNPSIDKSALNDVFNSSGYKKILTLLLLDNVSISPEELKEEGAISRLYSKVLEQTEALSNVLKDINNTAADSIKNQLQLVQDNIHFMESANQMYSFIQIPIKMFKQNSQGALFVRQNKKSSFEEGQEITAFLHFDMEYLGSTDVYIRMQNTSVSCNWNLSDMASLQLIEDNIDILNERLAEKGFALTSNLECTDKKFSFTKDFLQTKNSDKNDTGIIHRYSFDMRA